MNAEQPPKFTDEQINEIGVQHNRILEMHLKTMIERKLDYLELENFSEIGKIRKTSAFSPLSGNFQPTDEEISNSTKEIETARERLHNIIESTANVSELHNEINREMERVKSNFQNDNLSYNLILSMYSVAKYSADFWYSTNMGGSGLGLSLSREISIGLEQAVKITGKKLAEEDAYGATVGAIGWCGTAIFGGPVGLGAYVGAIVGGAAAASLDALWDARGIDFTPMCEKNSMSNFNVLDCRNKAQNDDELLTCMHNFFYKWKCCKLLGYKDEGCNIFMPPKN